MPRPLRPKTHIARRLRNDSTEPERLLWQALREHLVPWKFRRQHPIGHRIADFACPTRKLVIRFWNNEIQENLDGVLETIQRELQTPQTSSE